MPSQRLRFVKMHGLGNDFAIIDGIHQNVDAAHLPIKQLANRHVGIGFDQLLIIEKGQAADFFCRIFNADGSEAEQCGNGLRCVARFIQEEGLDKRHAFRIETKAGIYPLHIENFDRIRVTMGAPQINEYLFELKMKQSEQHVPLSILSVGNPHAILKVDSIHTDLAESLGPEIATHSYFPHGANVGFMQVLNDSHIRLRTFERGVGETHACGSNACAAAVAGIVNGWLKHHVTVEFRYGSLSIEWAGENEPIHMTGPATRVYAGEILS